MEQQRLTNEQANLNENIKLLIKIKEDKGEIPENVLETYSSSSICGKLQTYAILLRA